MRNIEFTYIYRDGSNYKKSGRVVFSNPDQLTCTSVERDLRLAFLSDGLFIARQVRIPDVFLYLQGPFSFDDHCYHEFGGIQSTTEEPTDEHDRSIRNFIVEASHEAKRGWQEFDPYDGRSAQRWSIAPVNR